MKKLLLLALAAMIFLSINSCEDNSTGPSGKLGGNTDLKLTEVGNETGVFATLPEDKEDILGRVKDTVVITKSENGYVTTNAKFTLDAESAKKLDTLLGTSELPEETKSMILDAYLKRFNAKLDTTDSENYHLEVDIKGYVTSEGIQDFMYSGGDTDKPFTLIKYNAKVGDKYTFTDAEGKKYTREVVSKSVDDDYPLGFIKIKVFKIEETQPDDPIIDKITYYANHKFGLVGGELKLKNGLTPTAKFLPWALLI